MKRFFALWLMMILLSWHLVPVQAARTFADGLYLQLTSALITTTPLTMCAWIRPTTADTSFIMGIGTAATDDHRWNIHIEADNRARSITRATTFVTTTSVATVTQNAWNTVCGRWVDATTRSIFVNGGNKINGATTSIVPSGMNRTFVGRGTGNTTTLDFNGDVAFASFWRVALTDEEIAAFGGLNLPGRHPWKIRPTDLVGCPPVWGDHSPELDLCGPQAWSLVGTPAKAASNPPVGLFSMSFGR